MNILGFLKSGAYLILFIILAFIGLIYGFYYLSINIFNSECEKITINELCTNGLGSQRNIEITDFILWDFNIQYSDKQGNIKSYVYFLSLPDTITSKKIVVAINTKSQLSLNNVGKISGLIAPFNYSIDPELTDLIHTRGFLVAKNNYYLELYDQPWKWYWNLLIIAISGLFLYRFFEMIINKVKKT